MRTTGVKVLLLALVVALAGALAVACAPGAKTESQGSGGGASVTQDSAQQKFMKSSGPYCQGKKEDKQLDGLKVGFSQSEKETNPFRSTETESVRSSAKDLGVNLLYANAQTQEPKQISDIRDLLSQGAEALVISPLLDNGLQSTLESARQKNIPVVLIDRETAGTPCKDWVTNIESDFVRQGEIAGDEMAKITGGKAKVAVLEGTPGASVTNDRDEGFKKALKDHPGLDIVASQTGNFVRTDGQQVMEQLIQSNPDIDAVYAMNDEMAIGAINALKAAGKDPGKDVKVISIDGTEDAAQAIVDGDMNALVTTNPRFGPIAFKVVKDYYAGKKIPQQMYVKDQLIDQSNAKAYLKSGAY